MQMVHKANIWRPQAVARALSHLRLITAPDRTRASALGSVECIPFRSGHPKNGLSVKRLFSATLNSLRGLRYGVRHEAAVREEAILLVFGVLLGLAVAPSAAWYVAMIGSLLILLAVELLNTAVEKLADYVTRERHTEIRKIKDFGSAAVFCALCLVGLVWLAAIAVRFGLV
jgi:diacylglycerol kinase (ATP)